MSRHVARKKCAGIAFISLFALGVGLLTTVSAGAEDNASIETLRKELAADSFEDRQKARDALLKMAEQFYGKIAAGLDDPSPEIRKGTEAVLLRLEGRLRLAKLTVGLPSEERKALDQIRPHRPEIFERMVSVRPADRKQACRELFDWGDALAVPLMSFLTRDEDGQVKRLAVKMLGKLRNVKALPRLQELVAEKEKAATGPGGVKNIAMRTFVSGNGVNALDEMDGRPVSQIAIESIGMLEHPEAAKFLAMGLGNPQGGTVTDYIRALGKSEQPFTAVPALMLFTRDNRKLSGLSIPALGAGGNGQVQVRIAGMEKVWGGKQPATVGDLAIDEVLTLSEQDDADYGLKEPAGRHFRVLSAVGGFLSNVNAKTFESDEARQKAIRKLEAWYADWSKENKDKLIKVKVVKPETTVGDAKPVAPPTEPDGF